MTKFLNGNRMCYGGQRHTFKCTPYKKCSPQASHLSRNCYMAFLKLLSLSKGAFKTLPTAHPSEKSSLQSAHQSLSSPNKFVLPNMLTSQKVFNSECPKKCSPKCAHRQKFSAQNANPTEKCSPESNDAIHPRT